MINPAKGDNSKEVTVFLATADACSTKASCLQVGGTCAFMSTLTLIGKSFDSLARLGITFGADRDAELRTYIDTLTACRAPGTDPQCPQP